MRTLAIDPGSRESAYVIIDEARRPVRVLNGGFAFDAPCEDCPGFIEGHDSYPDLLNDMNEEDRHGAVQNAG